MYDEEQIEDSLRFCKEIKTYYDSNVFQTPQNIFDWETYLPIARAEMEMRKAQESVDESRLRKAIELSQRVVRGSEIIEDHEQFFKRVPEEKEQILAGANGLDTTMEDIQQEMTDEIEEESFGRIMLQRFAEVVVCVSVAFGLSAVFNHFIGTNTVVEGSSMEAALQNEDNLFVDKISYRFSEPERFDIVVFPFDNETYYIKRIIGLPNETVQIINKKIYINGVELEENYGLEQMDDAGIAIQEIQLGEDEYFVLGDNRNHSTDSRFREVGNVKRDEIIGQAVFRWLPVENFGTLD